MCKKIAGELARYVVPAKELQGTGKWSVNFPGFRENSKGEFFYLFRFPCKLIAKNVANKKNHCLEWKLVGNHRHFEASLEIKLLVLFLRNQRCTELPARHDTIQPANDQPQSNLETSPILGAAIVLDERHS